MKLYLVQRSGVYLHETMGIYDSLYAAEQRAAECALPPDDGYHEYVISELDLNLSIDGAKQLSYYQGEWEGRYGNKNFLRVLKQDIIND